jgi:hypothetical protein
MRTVAGSRLLSKEEEVVLFAAVACCTMDAIDCVFEAGPGEGGEELRIAAAACLCFSTT